MPYIKDDLLSLGRIIVEKHPQQQEVMDCKRFYQLIVALWTHLCFVKNQGALSQITSWSDLEQYLQEWNLQWRWFATEFPDVVEWKYVWKWYQNDMVLSVDFIEAIHQYEALLDSSFTMKKGHLALTKSRTRKFQGGFYTSSKIISEALPQILPSTLSEKALKKQRICDPSCGVGHFLMIFAEYFYEKLHSAFSTAQECRLWILENCIFGVDIDLMAVDLCHLRFCLWTKAVVHRNIHQGDALLWMHPNCDEASINAYMEQENLQWSFFEWPKVFAAVFAKGGFTAIVGNPPYLFLSGANNPVTYWRSHDPILAKQWHHRIALYTLLYPTYSQKCKDLYKWFWNLLLELNPQKMALLLPNNWMRLSSYQDVQTGLIVQGMYEIWDFGFQAFSNVSLETCMVFLSSSAKKEIVYRDYRQVNAFPKRGTVQKIPVCNHSIHILQHPLFKKLQQQCSLQLKDVANITEGSHHFSVKTMKGAHAISIFLDHSLGKFRPPKSGLSTVQRPLKPNPFHQGTRILLRKTGDSLVSCVVDSEEIIWAHQNVYVLKSHQHFDIQALQGLLGSSLYTFLYQSSSFGQKSKMMAQLRIQGMRQLPIPTMETSQQKALANLAQKCQEFREDTIKYAKVLAQLDAFVYNLFDLSKQERQSIQQWQNAVQS